MITMKDIHKRLKLLPESAEVGKNYNSYLERAEAVIQSENPIKIMKMIESGINDTTNSILLDTMLDLYDALYEYGNEKNIGYYGILIAEDYIAKTRDAKEAQTNLKRKIGRIKTAVSTKVNGNIDDISDAIKKAINGAKGNLNANVANIKSNINRGLPKKKNKNSKAKNEAFIRGYENMLENATRIVYCDRILDNYNRISKRFNIDRIIQENIYKNGIEDTIGYICRLVETYDVPDKVKYNTVLETVWYGFGKNYVDCPPSKYVTLITDYYLAKGNNRYMCSKILEASMIVKKDDYDGDLEIITEEEPEDDILNNLKAENTHIQDQIRNQLLGVNEIISIALNEEADFNKIFKDFKASNDEHKETKLQSLIRTLFSKSPNQIIHGMPNVLSYIRIVFILGVFALNPILGAVSAISDIFLSLRTGKEQTKEMLNALDNEIKATNKKINTSKNPEEISRLKAYLKELKNGRDKIDEYYESKLTDEELDKKYEDSSEDSEDIDIGDDIDDDFDINFDEATIISIGNLSEKYSNLPIKELNENDIEEIVETADIYNEMVDVSINMPYAIDPKSLYSLIRKKVNSSKPNRSHIYENITFDNARYLLNEAASKLRTSKIAEYNDISISEQERYLSSLVEILEALNDIKVSCYYYHPLIEGSFTNSIALASEKVKKALTKLSDKERQVSKNIDVAANNTKKAIENSLTSANREAVIKGSVLPSASKTIKLAITTAGLALINPALAVITTLGYLATSKRYKEKERQMVIDEIEIELKMCEKYIDIAESKNDMKALKKLLTIQRELERQRQRIKYNMKIKFGQKYYDSTNSPESSIEN